MQIFVLGQFCDLNGASNNDAVILLVPDTYWKYLFYSNAVILLMRATYQSTCWYRVNFIS